MKMFFFNRYETGFRLQRGGEETLEQIRLDFSFYSRAIWKLEI